MSNRLMERYRYKTDVMDNMMIATYKQLNEGDILSVAINDLTGYPNELQFTVKHVDGNELKLESLNRVYCKQCFRLND